MGNIVCPDQIKEPSKLEQTISQVQKEEKDENIDLKRIQKLFENRIQVDQFPILKDFVEQNIRKLTKASNIKNKIWRVKNPLNIFYMNLDKSEQDKIAKGHCIVYKLKDNDFACYYEGKVNANCQILLKQSIFVYHNSSYFVGTGDKTGIYTNEKTGLKYHGGWKNEQPEGKGQEKNNKGQYSGQYHQGFKDGYGKFIWNDGAIYEGEFKNGLFHGKGKLVSQKQQYLYEGDYIQGQKHGKGIQIDNCQKYQGSYFQDKKSGYGKLIVYNDDNRKVINMEYKGCFYNNLPNGKGKAFHNKNNNKIISGIWQNGKLIAIL